MNSVEDNEMSDVARKRIFIDEAHCGATGNCVYWAPNTFELGDDGVARVINERGDSLEKILAAVENCPLRVIKLVEVIED